MDGRWYEGGVATRVLKAPRIDFSGIRRELELPDQFPLAAQREVDAAVQASTAGRSRSDRTDIPLVTIDPPTSRDLDQAMCIRRLDTGYRVFYAIADVTSFVSV